MNIKEIINKINIYNLMIFSLSIFFIIGVIVFGWKNTVPQVLIAVLISTLLDSIIKYYKIKTFKISKSGIITGFFIGLVLATNQNFYVPLFASFIAIAGKHFGIYLMNLIKQRNHIFNPAMMGIFISILLFKTSDGWWGAVNFIAVILLSLLILYKFKRFNLTLSFLVTYFLVLFLIKLSFNDLSGFENRFLDSTIYFFASFMLIEPKTSPTNYKGRIFYGIISGIIIALFTIFFPQYTLTLGLIVSNIFVPFINHFTISKI